MTEKRIILAFDIEMSGAYLHNDIIALGCSVMDEKFNELDTLFVNAYFPNDTNFEQRCWDEFWSKNTETLEILTYTGPMTKDERLKDMCEQFMNFRAKWEQYAEDNGCKYYLCSDNTVYDAGMLNHLLHKYMPDKLPMPYTVCNPRYSMLYDVHQMQLGFLKYAEPKFKSYYGLTNKIGELYTIPDKVKEHNHLPDFDAYTIAHDLNVLLGIQEGTIFARATNKTACGDISKAIKNCGRT